ncbi:MAG: ThiF family adenylyltransferase [Gemmataceae bacterium]
MNPLSDRAIRQRELIPPERLARSQAVVIGVGAIGRQVALQLAALGAPQLLLIDHDVVAVENLAVQGYWPSDLELLKVKATATLCRHINPEMNLQTVPERFRRSLWRDAQLQSDVAVFFCVDSIATRKVIWDSVHSRVGLVIDGRMNGEVLRVLASDQPQRDAHYPSTLFAASEAYLGSCTARSTIYAASIAAGLMVGQFARQLRDLPVIADQTLNLLAAELLVG